MKVQWNWKELVPEAQPHRKLSNLAAHLKEVEEMKTSRLILLIIVLVTLIFIPYTRARGKTGKENDNSIQRERLPLLKFAITKINKLHNRQIDSSSTFQNGKNQLGRLYSTSKV